MIKNIAALIAALLIGLLPLSASADAISDLQAQLRALIAQIAQLQTPQPVTPAIVSGQPDDYGTGTTNTGVYCPKLSITMQKGSRDARTGNQVSELQSFLTDYYNLDEGVLSGGYFGNVTHGRVVAFQETHGLPALGIVGSMTRAKIASVCGGQTPPPTTVNTTVVPTYSWTTGGWTSCSDSSQSRTVSCVSSANASVADSFCTSSKPSITQSCTLTQVALSPGNPATQSDIGGVGGELVLREWPEPVNTVAVPWKQIAQNFDAVIFNGAENKLGDSNFFWTNVQGYNHPAGSAGFGLTAYYSYSFPTGVTAEGVTEGIVSLDSLVGGSLAGIDYTAKRMPSDSNTRNLVRLAKKWFQSTTGANAFLNNVPSNGGIEFWYDLMPSISACQLAALYGSEAEKGVAAGEPTLEELCLRSIDTWYNVVNSTRLGRDVGEFAYKAYQLVPGKAYDHVTNASLYQPIAVCASTAHPKRYSPPVTQADLRPAPICIYDNNEQTQYHSESAGGIGWLAMYAYAKTGDPKYKQLTDWTLTYLDRINYNPNYENMLPYGVLAAARLNAEEGTRHNVGQFLDWTFSESETRYFWTMLSGTWGNYPVYGLVGQPEHTVKFAHLRPGVPYELAQAASYDSMLYPRVLAPVARYVPQYAAAIGKYLAWAQTSSRLFYPAYAPYADATTTSYLAQLGDSRVNNGVPFEGLNAAFPGVSTVEPFATGPSTIYGYKTNLAIYGGAMAGGMAALYQPTDVAGIYQIDLLVTDFPRPDAYPTYLFYNPYGEREVSVNIAHARAADARLGTGSVKLYDSVSKTILTKGVGNSLKIPIGASSARVIVVVPESESLKLVGNKLLTGTSGIVVDHSYLAPVYGVKTGHTPAPPPIVVSATITSPTTRTISSLAVTGTVTGNPTNLYVFLAPANYTGATDVNTLYNLQSGTATRTYGLTAQPSNGAWSASFSAIPNGSYKVYVFNYSTSVASLLTSGTLTVQTATSVSSTAVTTSPTPVTASSPSVTTPATSVTATITQSTLTQPTGTFSLTGTVTGSPTTLFVFLAPASYTGATDINTLYNLQASANNRTYGVTTQPSGNAWSASYQSIPSDSFKVYVFDYSTAAAPLLTSATLVVSGTTAIQRSTQVASALTAVEKLLKSLAALLK